MALRQMDDIKKKVYLDLFASPVTLLPFVGGLTALLVSWALGGNAPLTFGGLAGTLSGIGMLASRLVFGLERLTEDAYQFSVERHRRNKEASLNRLRQQLEQDGDPRTQSLLDRLQRLYSELEANIESGKISFAAHEVLERVDRMFQVCVEHLEHSFRSWRRSGQLGKTARKQALERREHLVSKVEESVNHLEQTLDQLHSMSMKKGESDLSRLRSELDETIDVARRTERRVAEIGLEDGSLESEGL